MRPSPPVAADVAEDGAATDLGGRQPRVERAHRADAGVVGVRQGDALAACGVLTRTELLGPVQPFDLTTTEGGTDCLSGGSRVGNVGDHSLHSAEDPRSQLRERTREGPSERRKCRLSAC